MKTYYEDKWVFPLYLLIAAICATVDSYWIDNEPINAAFYFEMIVPFTFAAIVYFALTKHKIKISNFGVRKKGINHQFDKLKFLIERKSFYFLMNVVVKNNGKNLGSFWNIGTRNIAKGLLENVPKDHPDYKVLEEFYRVQNKLFK